MLVAEEVEESVDYKVGKMVLKRFLSKAGLVAHSFRCQDDIPEEAAALRE
jgi:hypothetical protein